MVLVRRVEEDRESLRSRRQPLQLRLARGPVSTWQFEGQVLRQSDIRVSNATGPFIVERPKVLCKAPGTCTPTFPPLPSSPTPSPGA